MPAGYDIGSPDPMSPLNSPMRLHQADQAATSLNNLAIQEGQQKLQEGAITLDQMQREQQFWRDRMGGGAAPSRTTQSQQGPSVPASPGMQLMQLGQEMLGKGVVKPGLAMIEHGSTLTNQESEIQARNMTVAKERVAMLGSMAGAVRDQDSYDNFRVYMRSQGMHQVDNLPDDYNLAASAVSQLAEGSVSAAKQLELQQRQTLNGARIANMSSLAAHRQVMEGIEKRRVQLEKQRIENAGGKELVASSNEQGQAEKLIRSTLFPDIAAGKGTTVDEITLQNAIKAGAGSIATEAKRIATQNRGISYNEALQQALAESKKNGDWDTTTSYAHSIMGFKWGAKQQQRFKGPKVLTPDTKPEAGQLYSHKGKTYMGTGDGRLIEDTGGGGASSGEDDGGEE